MFQIGIHLELHISHIYYYQEKKSTVINYNSKFLKIYFFAKSIKHIEICASIGKLFHLDSSSVLVGVGGPVEEAVDGGGDLSLSLGL